MKRRTNPLKHMGGKMIPVSEVDRLIDKAVEQKVQVVLQAQTFSHYSGPTPPADETAKFEQLHPGFTNRLLSMSEKNQDAQIESNRRREWMSFSDAILGKLIAAAVIFGFLGGGIILLLKDKTTEGWVALATGIATILLALNSSGKESRKP